MGRMKSAFWFVVGVVGGFVAAHIVNKDPRGHELLAELDGRIAEFTDRIADAYRDQEAKMEGYVAEVKDAASDAVVQAKDVASGVLSSAKDAAASAIDTTKDAVATAVDATKDAASDAADTVTDATARPND